MRWGNRRVQAAHPFARPSPCFIPFLFPSDGGARRQRQWNRRGCTSVPPRSRFATPSVSEGASRDAASLVGRSSLNLADEEPLV